MSTPVEKLASLGQQVEEAKELVKKSGLLEQLPPSWRKTIIVAGALVGLLTTVWQGYVFAMAPEYETKGDALLKFETKEDANKAHDQMRRELPSAVWDECERRYGKKGCRR